MTNNHSEKMQTLLTLGMEIGFTGKELLSEKEEMLFPELTNASVIRYCEREDKNGNHNSCMTGFDTGGNILFTYMCKNIDHVTKEEIYKTGEGKVRTGKGTHFALPDSVECLLLGNQKRARQEAKLLSEKLAKPLKIKNGELRFKEDGSFMFSGKDINTKEMMEMFLRPNGSIVAHIGNEYIEGNLNTGKITPESKETTQKLREITGKVRTGLRGMARNFLKERETTR